MAKAMVDGEGMKSLRKRRGVTVRCLLNITGTRPTLLPATGANYFYIYPKHYFQVALTLHLDIFMDRDVM